MTKHDESKKRKSGYNPDREHHASDDCMSYTYARWNEETHKYDTITLPAGEGGLTQDIILSCADSSSGLFEAEFATTAGYMMVGCRVPFTVRVTTPSTPLRMPISIVASPSGIRS